MPGISLFDPVDEDGSDEEALPLLPVLLLVVFWSRLLAADGFTGLLSESPWISARSSLPGMLVVESEVGKVDPIPESRIEEGGVMRLGVLLLLLLLLLPLVVVADAMSPIQQYALLLFFARGGWSVLLLFCAWHGAVLSLKWPIVSLYR